MSRIKHLMISNVEHYNLKRKDYEGKRLFH